MTRYRSEIWTIAVVSFLTMLVWLWAAGELNEQDTVQFDLTFETPRQSTLVLDTSSDNVSVIIRGPARALREVAAQRTDPIELSLGSASLPSEPGRHDIVLLEVLRQHPVFSAVSVIECSPTTVQIVIDELDMISGVEVRPVLKGVLVEGETAVQPSMVTLEMPRSMRGQVEDLFVTVEPEEWRLQRLTPGAQSTLEVDLKLPPALANNPHVRVTPRAAAVTLTVRTQIREHKLETVRVQLAGPPEDAEDYVVSIEPRQLRDITISAESEIIELIQTENAPIIALVHLTSREKERHITSKRITCFLALIPLEGGGVEGVEVEAVFPEGGALPEVALEITDRASIVP